jgi:hypothetical protein
MAAPPKDRIAGGDRVSWALDMPGAVRQFGTVTGRKRQGRYPVKDAKGVYRLIPARFITKECG